MKLLPLILFLLTGCKEIDSKTAARSAPDVKPPSPPELSLLWEHDGNCAGFHLYASPNLRDWSLAATIPHDATNFSILNNQPQMFYRLAAF